MKSASKLPHLRSPKVASAIMLEEQSQLHFGDSNTPLEPRSCSLAEKIEELVLKEGYTNAQTLSVIVQLLTLSLIHI